MWCTCRSTQTAYRASPFPNTASSSVPLSRPCWAKRQIHSDCDAQAQNHQPFAGADSQRDHLVYPGPLASRAWGAQWVARPVHPSTKRLANRRQASRRTSNRYQRLAWPATEKGRALPYPNRVTKHILLYWMCWMGHIQLCHTTTLKQQRMVTGNTGLSRQQLTLGLL